MKKFDLTLFLLIFMLVLPSARVIFKYINILQPIPMLIYAGGIIGLIVLLKNKQLAPLLKKWIGNYWYIAFVLLCVSVVVLLMYPIADGLKIQMRGSDQDDCVIIGATQLLNLSHPYTQNSYFGNPCSPGLGMLLLYAPFVAVNLYPLGAIVFAVFAILTIQRYFSGTFEAAVLSTFFFTSAFVIETLVVGSDLFLLGCGLVILSFQLIQVLTSKSLLTILWLAVLTGLLASTRVNFIVLVPVLSIFIFLQWRSGAVIFAILSACVAVIPSFYIYLLNPAEFTPLHLVGKSELLLQGGFKEIGAIASAIAFVIGCYLVRKSASFIPSALLLSLAPSLIVVAAGDLVLRGGDITQWEGANYLMPVFPLAVAWLINRLSEPSYITLNHYS